MPELPSRRVRVDDLAVHLAEVGSGPPLLLVHGFLVNHREWLDVLPALSKRFRCLAVDLPGFGQSDKPLGPSAPYGWVGYANFLRRLLDVLDVPKAHVMGHSMGGGIAVTFSADHADRVDKLVVIDGACYPFTPPLKGRLPLIPGIGPIVFKRLYGRALFHDYFRNEVWSGHAGIDLERVDDYYREFNSREAREAAYEVMLHTVDPSPVTARIPTVKAPTLVVWGNEDRLFPLAFGERLARELSNARLAVLEGVGHTPHEERAAETAALLLGHLAP